MASSKEVKDYIAQWLQLGKHLEIGDQTITLTTVRQSHAYSPDYEILWQKISCPATAKQIYLSGCDQSIEDLLSPRWQIVNCYRCHGLIPTPLFQQGMCLGCPCADLPALPDVNLVMPHPPIDSQQRLQQVADRVAV
jgi:hypothetical protein